MPGYGFTPRATRSFREIAEYSRETFGPARGRQYMKAMLDVCDGIARGKMVTRSCRTVFADDLRDDLRFARSGRHLIIFLPSAGGVTIVDFIHQSADLIGRLGGEAT